MYQSRSVGLSERPKPGEVGSQTAKAGVADGRDHGAPEERPRRLAVDKDDRRALALVEMGQAQPFHLAVVGLEGEVGKALEGLRGRAHDLGHGAGEHTRRLIG